jgi:isoleucyl-tRNA synthetase
VLTTLAKLIAPVVPFLAESLWRNLGVRGQESEVREESVHLCDFPQVDESLIDAELSADMEALLRLVTLGSAARNSVKIKVRQPLAELKIQPASDAERRAVDRFADQLREELNIKRVTIHEGGNSALLRPVFKANLKMLGPKCGPHLHAVKSLIESVAGSIQILIDGTEEETTVTVGGNDIPLSRADFTIQHEAADGWAGAVEGKTQAAVDTRITPELELEGLAREVVRQAQDARKKAKLEVEDRIVLCLTTDSDKLRAAIAAHRATIAAECLVSQWADQLDVHAAHSEVMIEGYALAIALRKA